MPSHGILVAVVTEPLLKIYPQVPYSQDGASHQLSGVQKQVRESLCETSLEINPDECNLVDQLIPGSIPEISVMCLCS